jgi:type VI protein secretion system component Hcp
MEVAELYLALTGPNGRVNGEVKAEDYVDQIDIVDWSWGAELSKEQSDTGTGSATANRTEPKSLTLKKRMDKSSTALMSGAVNLTKFPRAVITMLHRAEKKMKLTVTLQGVRIESYKLTVNDNDPDVTMDEELTLAYEVFRIEYIGRSTASGAAAARSFELRTSN